MNPYPAYKSTNLPWLPKIPEHWSRLRYKDILVPKDIRVGKDTSYTLLSLTKQGVIIRDISEGKGKFPKDFDTYKVVAKNDFILCLFDVDETPRTVGVANDNGMITGAYDIFTVRRCNLRWLYYHFLSLDDRKSLKSLYRGLRKTIPLPSLLSSHVYLPPVAEQEQIVRYLDSMTAKINKLIRAKKKQIALLQEQRQAIINQAVTKGLDPNVEMKDSGQPRIGTIPRHWLLKEVKRMCRLQGGSGFPVEYQGNFSESIPFIKVNSLSSHISVLRQYDTVSPETAKLLNAKVFSQGDIVFAKVGAALLLHRFEILPFDCCIDNNMMAMYNISENVYWLKYALSLLDFNNLVNPGAVPSISQTQVGCLLIPCPPKSEQMEIVSHIERHGRKIDSLISRIEQSINCLQEYKNCLISSVVTGQTDARNIPVEDVIPDDLIPEDDPTSEIEDEPANESEE